MLPQKVSKRMANAFTRKNSHELESTISKELRTAFYRKHAPKSGCCGLTELLKLYAWTLTGFHRVVHLDTDSLVLGNMNELFEMDASLVYTCDYNMMNARIREKKPGVPCAVQGGFVVVKPSFEVFDGMLEIVREGKFGAGFKLGASGWNGTGIGHWWGGATFQGVVPFYYEKVADSRRFPAMEVDRCIYDNMVDDPINPPPRKGGRDCRATPLADIKNVHFTLCQKPWNCGWPEQPGDEKQHLCKSLHGRWMELREKIMAKLSITSDLTEVPPEKLALWHRGGCWKGKYRPYAPLV